MTRANLRINSGYFVFSKNIFDYIHEGEELVREPFQRLIKEKRLLAYEHDGFFQAMDTFKDRQILEGMLASGHAPWEVWKTQQGADAPSEASNGRSAPAPARTSAGKRHA